MLLDGLDKDRLLVVGVSGGADSLALLHLLYEAGYPLVVCHFNHRLRPEAEAEAAFVQSITAGLGLQFEAGSGDVGAFAGENHLSIEEAARKLRYRFLFERARAHSAQAVAVGHTADDQVETVLMHFLRGAGLSGLKGMLPRTIIGEFDPEIPLVRPILDLWRADTEAFCRAHGLEFRTDPSNTDQTYFRNRLRLSLIPVLEQYNPGFKGALLRSSKALQGDFELLATAVDNAGEATIVEQEAGFVAFDEAALAELPLAMRRNLIRRAAYDLRPGLRDADFDALERAAAMPIRSDPELLHGPVDLAGGLRLFSEAGRVYLAAPEAVLPAAQWPQIPGEVSSAWNLRSGDSLDLANGWLLTSEIRSRNAATRTDSKGFAFSSELGQPGGPSTEAHGPAGPLVFSAWLDASSTGDVLEVRTARPGDRIEPLGMPGRSVKLSDLFINLKVPRRARARWPLVCLGNRVAWVPGLRQSHQDRITDATTRFWLVTVRGTRSGS